MKKNEWAPKSPRVCFYFIFQTLGYTKKRTIETRANNDPLKASASGVPVLSAMAPKGRPLKGMTPNVIIVMLMILPCICREAYVCMSVRFNDMKTALKNPMARRKGTAVL